MLLARWGRECGTTGRLSVLKSRAPFPRWLALLMFSSPLSREVLKCVSQAALILQHHARNQPFLLRLLSERGRQLVNVWEIDLVACGHSADSTRRARTGVPDLGSADGSCPVRSFCHGPADFD